MTLFERIKETARKKSNTLTNLSITAGLGEKTIYKWKTQDPKTETLQRVADVLGVSVDYLLGNTNDMHSTLKSDDNLDLEKMFDGAEAFDGRPISNHDKEVIRALIKSCLDANN